MWLNATLVAKICATFQVPYHPQPCTARSIQWFTGHNVGYTSQSGLQEQIGYRPFRLAIFLLNLTVSQSLAVKSPSLHEWLPLTFGNFASRLPTAIIDDELWVARHQFYQRTYSRGSLIIQPAVTRGSSEPHGEGQARQALDSTTTMRSYSRDFGVLTCYQLACSTNTSPRMSASSTSNVSCFNIACSLQAHKSSYRIQCPNRVRSQLVTTPTKSTRWDVYCARDGSASLHMAKGDQGRSSHMVLQ